MLTHAVPVLANFHEVAIDLGYAALFAVVIGIVGIGLMLLASRVLPALINRLTPSLDEEKEIARGNSAVADYFGRVVGGAIIGASIIIAAAVLAGVWAALN